MSRATRTERFEMRMTAENKALIAKAAEISGQSLSEFAIGAVMKQALEMLERYDRTQLTVDDREAFLKLIDSDSEPTERLRSAARSFLERRSNHE